MRKQSLFMPMRLQFFAADTGGEAGGAGDVANSDMQDLNNMLDGMGAAGTDSNSGDAGVSTGTDSQADGDAGDGSQTETDPKKQTQNSNNKQEYAFAQMRTQNTQLFGLLSKVAQAAGIEFKDNNELLTKLNDDALGKLAKAQNVPVELLKRLEQLEQTDKVYQAEQLKNSALIGFQKVKDAYGLTDDELRGFAAELDTKGKNPFLTQVDLEAEYRLNHFQDILKKETAKAVEEALKKSNAADKHSSTPNNAQGKPDTGNGEKITTMAGLNDILKDMK